VTVIWTGEHQRQQGRLVAEMYQAAAGVPCERSAAIAGGLPGADKTAALDQAGLDRSQYLTVSIDAVLDRMAAARLIPAADGLSPLERAGLVHAEAQYLAKRVGLRALMDGRNLILDVSLASWRAAESWTYALRFADYAVTAVFADISIDEAVRRSDEAHRRGEEAFRRGHGRGGRRIPATAIRALASPAAAAPRNRIRWAVGARSAGAIGGTVGTGTFPGSAVIAMLVSYRDGRLSLDDLCLEFRARRWPGRLPAGTRAGQGRHRRPRALRPRLVRRRRTRLRPRLAVRRRLRRPGDCGRRLARRLSRPGGPTLAGGAGCR
jgi:hypothetical protein